MTLVELMMAFGILSTMALALAALNTQVLSQSLRASSLSEVDIFRQKLVRAIQNDEAWHRTLVQPINLPRTACLRTPGSQCINTAAIQYVGYNANRNPRLALFNAAGKDDETYASGALTDGSIYDTTNAFNGITLDGKKCGPHAADPTLQTANFPSLRCPLRYEVRWFATSTNRNPMIAVYATLRVSQFAQTIVNANRFSIGACAGFVGGVCTQMQTPLYRRAQ